jgi:hypothetical protein
MNPGRTPPTPEIATSAKILRILAIGLTVNVCHEPDTEVPPASEPPRFGLMACARQ